VLDAVPVVQPASADSLARTAGIAVRDVPVAVKRLQELGLVERTAAGWRRTPVVHAC
jgi:DNA processing protein